MSKSNATRLAAAVLLCVAAMPTQGFSWNFVGHETIARIAWENLTPQARTQMRALIRRHPALNADLLSGMPADFGDRDLFAFMVSATWPDVIRSERNPWHGLHRPAWHYINMPFILAGTNRAALKDAVEGPMTWQPGAEPLNVVQALQKCEKDLRDPNLPAPDKAVALSWFLHMAGDLHQPLHANTLFSDRFPAGDKGGNGSVVQAPVLTTQPALVSSEEVAASIAADNLLRSGTSSSAAPPATLPSEAPINLHSYWDNIFGRFGAPRVLDALQNEITTEHPPAELRDVMANLHYDAWATESNDVAIREVRRDGTLDTGTSDELKDANHGPFPALPADYLTRAQATSRLRMATAGYRIASVLNGIFDAK